MIKKKIILTTLVAIAYLLPTQITHEISAPATFSIAEAAAPFTPSIPTRIQIPKAKVDTNIIQIGITPKGNLDVPNNYTEVGWYKYGAKPGEMGSAVLDGHVDDAKRTPGPFKHLRNVKLGDEVFITLENGTVQKYKITRADVYALDDFPGEMVFHEADNRYIKIITCHGKFVPKLDTYNQRLIVTAVLVS